METIYTTNNPLYKGFFKNNEQIKIWYDNKYIYNSIWRGEPSDNSFCLKPANCYRSAIPHILIDRFDIKDPERFRTKYLQAISGDGQEWTRITTLHSSSLIALLCFYSISENNPITIDEYVFTQSFFEVKTQVYGESESNMDVVLRGCDSHGQKVVLFLESKFSEYLICGSYNGISQKAYLDTYNDTLRIIDNDAITAIKISIKDDGISIEPREPRRNPVYCGGIKQMISHFMGVSNYAEKGKEALGEHSCFDADSSETILLGEILFDFGDKVGGAKTKLDTYHKAYRDLQGIINERQNKVKMIDALTYQDLFAQNKSVIKETPTLALYML